MDTFDTITLIDYRGEFTFRGRLLGSSIDAIQAHWIYETDKGEYVGYSHVLGLGWENPARNCTIHIGDAQFMRDFFGYGESARRLYDAAGIEYRRAELREIVDGIGSLIGEPMLNPLTENDRLDYFIAQLKIIRDEYINAIIE